MQQDIQTKALQHEMDNKLLPSQIKDRARFGGNYMKVKGDENLKHQPFYLFVGGHIESGEFSYADGICCKYDYIAGNDWSLFKGNNSGVS
mmetsp:Transcript_147/g.106  ORF Transcript_147/g.106 Transcript_147/m.106 type:complete len:90 (+) Transcript_147:122-391(+)